MNSTFFKFLYFLVGLCVGLFSFWMLHASYPNMLHEHSANEQAWKLKSIETDLPAGEEGAQIKYGYILITETSERIGPLATETNMRFAGNNLSCNNCHLAGGRKIGAGSFVGVYNRFPQFRGREK